jgi:MoaA/NifB/PqqE/SkfB family radical SAM enzyme
MDTLIKLSDVSDQTFITVTTSCNLKCHNCSLWEKGDLTTENITSLIQENRFFSHFPIVGTYNVVGGDPLMFVDIVYLFTFLKSKGIKTRLWTNGIFSINNFESLKGIVDEIVLYFPSPIKESYSDYTGLATLESFIETLDYLKQDGFKVLLNYPITPETLPDLADAYELAYYRNLQLITHYSKYDRYSKDSIAFIKRFYKIKDVWVFQEDIYNPRVCRAVPVRSFLMKRFHVMNLLRTKLSI